jgi:hypothetical protein
MKHLMMLLFLIIINNNNKLNKKWAILKDSELELLKILKEIRLNLLFSILLTPKLLSFLKICL